MYSQTDVGRLRRMLTAKQPRFVAKATVRLTFGVMLVVCPFSSSSCSYAQRDSNLKKLEELTNFCTSKVTACCGLCARKN